MLAYLSGLVIDVSHIKGQQETIYISLCLLVTQGFSRNQLNIYYFYDISDEFLHTQTDTLYCGTADNL